MYESFGVSKRPDGRYGFSLFIPDNGVDPAQYSRGGPCRIASVGVIGSFQSQLGGGSTDWDAANALPMTREGHRNGLLFTAVLPAAFPDGFYEYKYQVTFENGQQRTVGDPCTKYGGESHDNSAFLIGGQVPVVDPLPAASRKSGGELRIYELMLDDFTAGYRGDKAPLEAVLDKLDYIADLGVNAIEFMPWVAWPDTDGFSWGYDPAYFFSVESHYVFRADEPLERLTRLAELVSACHQKNLMVLLDIVLQHAAGGSTGFPYYWLWQDPSDSPFIGAFVQADSLGSLPLDYDNACTLELVADTCKYWADRFGVDGFRFDQVSGYHNRNLPTKGAPALIAELRAYAASRGLADRFPLILEDEWDWRVIDDTNEIGATHGWFEVFRANAGAAISYGGKPGTGFMQVLNAAKGFNFPIGPVSYLENHDHFTLALQAGGRQSWYRTQPYAIALATMPGAIMLCNGQEFARVEFMPEPGDDSTYPRDQQRINPRPLRWNEADDAIGTQLRALYSRLLRLRAAHPSLWGPMFYPDSYSLESTQFAPDGYGIDVDRGVVIYHRWGDNNGHLEHLIIVLCFSDTQQAVDVPFPTSGAWTDLLNPGRVVTVSDFWVRGYPAKSNWGCIFLQST